MSRNDFQESDFSSIDACLPVGFYDFEVIKNHKIMLPSLHKLQAGGVFVNLHGIPDDVPVSRICVYMKVNSV